MEGETNPGLNISSATIYANSSLSSQKEIVYVSSIDNNSDCINKGIKDFASFSEGKYNSFYALEKINEVEPDLIIIEGSQESYYEDSYYEESESLDSDNNGIPDNMVDSNHDGIPDGFSEVRH